MNYHNFAQRTNWTGGSDKFPLVPFYLTSLNIPGINFNLPLVGARYGTAINLSSDTVSFNTLNFEFLVDENFEIFDSFYNSINDSLNIEDNTFNNKSFDFWIELNNNKGNKIKKFEFYNCRIESIGDIELDSTNSETEITMSLSLKFDYYKLIE